MTDHTREPDALEAPPTVRLCLILHNHQPVGNFDGVFEQAYQDSYLPFLDVFESYPDLRLALHTSGPLMEWLDAHHSEYVDRLAALVASGRIEIVGGAFYEPILTMIPSRDRVGQITRYTEWLQERLGATIHGLWMPERVWEQSLVSDLARSDIRYTVLDDFHFKSAGLTEDQLTGPYLTEDSGNLITVFPGSERLRYLLPFAAPHETIDYLRGIAERHPGAVMVFGDDGEKFGTWPDTKKHVYEDGWLRGLFDQLVANQDWLKLTTPTEAISATLPLGKVYVPECSYREMTEWALPAESLAKFEHVRHDFEREGRWAQVAPYVHGGFWRNFKRKYPETDEMYCRMQGISQRLHLAIEAGQDASLLDAARTELYRGQCNCSYWHGAFGGVYLPHLRHAIYQHLITADNLLEQAARGTDQPSPWIEATIDDFNLDGRQEVRLANDRLVSWIAPASGGQLYELDVRSICHNLLATLARRPEAYHDKILAGPSDQNGDVASIHQRVVFKQEGLDREIQYDANVRKSLQDHFYNPDISLAQVVDGTASEQGDFLTGVYEARVRRNPDRIQVQLVRDGRVWDQSIKITKGVTLAAGSSQLEIAYLLENLPHDCPLHFAVELNFAGMPDGADDRYFYDAQGNSLGQLGTQLDLIDAERIGLVDQWLGIDVALSLDRPSGIWTYPIRSVSQSEGGFERVHQSVVVQPHWIVQGDADGRWSMTMTLAIDTTMADERHSQPPAVAVTH